MQKRPKVSANAMLTVLGAIALAPTGCGGGGGGPVALDVSYDNDSERILGILNRGLADGETLHLRVRGGEFGELDCARDHGSISRIDGSRVKKAEKPTYAGPEVSRSVFEPVMDSSWLTIDEPTPEMLAALDAASQIIDMCVMNDGKVVRQGEFSVQQALDRAGDDGKYDGEGGFINSVERYAELCVEPELLGEIPFFPPVRDQNGDIVPGDYETYNCLDGVVIPSPVTVNGEKTFPADRDHEGVENGGDCDAPMHLDSHCERNAVPGESNGPRAISATNEQGTHWFLLCRKTGHEEGEFRDMAMIGHNPVNGKTCFFQNALGSRTDGVHVTHPGDTVSSEASPERSGHIWQGLHGGLGSGIECTECHDADPIIHTPWIDGAVWPDDHPEVTGETAREWESRGVPPDPADRDDYTPISADRRKAGAPIAPMMGVDEDFFIGNNSAPYTVVNMEGQGWEMAPHLVNEKAGLCTSCHRMAGGQWADRWMNRQDLEDSSYTSAMTDHGKQFEERIWMPPNEVLAEEGIFTEADFDSHPFRDAITFIQSCGDSWKNDPDWETRECDPTGDECCWEKIPSETIDFDGELPDINEEGEDLARLALIAMGAPIEDPSCPENDEGERSCETQRCNACHAMSPPALEHWDDVTDSAISTCNLGADVDDLSQSQARDTVDCMRADGNPDGVFAADRIGIWTTGVKYDMFPKLFQKAYGDDWRREFNRFNARIGMPQGNHPKLSLEEYAAVRKWFAKDLPNLDDVFVETGRPEECRPQVDLEAMTAHVEKMKFEGWAARNNEDGIRMFGCTDSEDPNTCFLGNEFRDVTSQLGGDVADGFRLVEVTTFDFVTSFWTRSSADGRFVGNGGGTVSSSTITDLQQGRDIAVDAQFDPGFFPDNKGFMFQSPTGICEQSLLLSDNHITFSEDACIRAHGIDLYQHVARGTEGNRDYFIITGQHVNDPGSATNDPSANFGESARIGLTPVIHTGSTYRQGEEVNQNLPYEGDSVLSPTGQLMVSRLSGPDGSLGYVVRQFQATPNGNSYDVNVSKKLATVCQQGVKANFSYDERFVVTQHYNGDGTADIWLMDLLDVDGQGNAARHRLTRMPAGQKALFPHFINNGWFYFLLRDGNTRKLVASNAAAIIANGGGDTPPPPGDSNCCEDGSDSGTSGFDRKGCDNATCEASICAADGWCCQNEWDDICQNAAIASCAVCE